MVLGSAILRMLDHLITSKTRLKLLLRFFTNPKDVGYLRGLAEEFGESTNAIRKELNRLSESGLLLRLESNDSQKVDYKANEDHPYFITLHELTRKYLGFDQLVEIVLERMGVVSQVAVKKPYWHKTENNSLVVIISGDNINQDYLSQLKGKLENYLQKKLIFNLNGEVDQEDLVLYKKNN